MLIGKQRKARALLLPGTKEKDKESQDAETGRKEIKVGKVYRNEFSQQVLS